MKSVDLTNVQESGDYSRPAPGAYICTITAIEDISAKEYLKVIYDIAEGDYKGYYGEMRKNNPDWAWAGAYVKSYKPAALPMFKRFCTAVSRSNGAYVFDGGKINKDEQTLVGKKIGLLFREEEYYGNDGEKKTRLSISGEFPVDKLAEQKVPKIKLLKDDNADISSTPSSTPYDDFVNVPDNTPTEAPFD